MSSVPIPWLGARSVATFASLPGSRPSADVMTVRQPTILADIHESVRSVVGDSIEWSLQVGLTEQLAGPVSLWSSPGMPKRREKIVDDGDAKIVDDQAASPAEGLELAQSILADCPDGYHPWRVEIQKSDRGRRAAVRVWFKRNALRGEDSEHD